MNIKNDQNKEHLNKVDQNEEENWDKTDLIRLLELIQKYNENWSKISNFVTNFSPFRIKKCYKKLKLKWVNEPWKDSEDNLLFSVSTPKNKINWSERSITLGTRSPEQCKKRWNELESKYVTIGTWTHSEQLNIFKLLEKYSFRWKSINKKIPYRTSNSIKGLVHASLRKIKKMKIIYWCLYKFARWPTFTNKSRTSMTK
jgi:hypothetical protein